MCGLIDDEPDQSDSRSRAVVPVPRPALRSPKNSLDIKRSEAPNASAKARPTNDHKTLCYSARCLLRSDSISASKCIGVQGEDYL